MRLTREGVITLMILIVLLVIAIYGVQFARERSQEKQRLESPAGVALRSDTNSFTNLSGEPVRLLDSFEQVTVAYTWASWCPQCAVDLVALSELSQEYREGRDIVIEVLAINRREPQATAERFLAQIQYADSLTLVIDTEDTFYMSIGGYAMPELVVYNEQGEEVMRQRGAVDLEALRTTIDELLPAAD